MNKVDRQAIGDEMGVIRHEINIALSYMWAVPDERAHRHLRECLKFIAEATQRAASILRVQERPQSSGRRAANTYRRTARELRPPQDIRRVK